MSYPPLNHDPDPNMTYVVGMSGGKDSVATWIYLTHVLGLKNVVCSFGNTSHEAILTILYLLILRDSYALPLVVVQPLIQDLEGELKPHKIACRLFPERFPGLTDSSEPDDMEQAAIWDSVKGERLTMERLSILKRRFPSPMVRFCTTFLKLVPQVRWMKAVYPCDVVRVAGVRAEESKNRAKRPTWEHDKLFGCPLWLPLHAWKHADVFSLHSDFQIPVNPLYTHGMGRVGCWPCIMESKPELCAKATAFPAAFVSLGEMEQRVANSVGKPAMSFFARDKTPERFHSQTCQNSGKTFPVASDVATWATSGRPVTSPQQFLEFKEDESEDAYACTSRYGLCE